MSNDSDIPQITILTPTWNRRHLLPRLYQSLVDQEAPRGTFDWLVVDDGSTDGTSEWLEALISDAPFSIRLIRQENGGKHRALNRAAPELVAPWVLIIDSDDWLLPGAMKQIIKDTVAAGPDVRAIVAPLDIVGFEERWFRLPESGRLVDYAEWQGQTQVGDTSIVMRGRTLLDNLFPEFQGENYVSPAAVWAPAFLAGGVLLSSDRIAGAEYQPDGLSARWLHNSAKNPLGSMAVARARIKASAKGVLRLRLLLVYHRFFLHAKRSGRRPADFGFHVNPLLLIPASLLYIRDLIRLSRRRRSS